MPYQIRPATSEDAEPIANIYRPYVLNTVISFETEPPSPQAMAERIEHAIKNYAWLVVCSDSQVVGYAYGSAHRPRAAYQSSVEVSAYLHPDHQRRGLASQLYQQLLPQLSEMGYHRAFAGIALPNDASVALHRSIGFEAVGVFREVGRKFDRWHDVSWWQRAMSDN